MIHNPLKALRDGFVHRVLLLVDLSGTLLCRFGLLYNLAAVSARFGVLFCSLDPLCYEDSQAGCFLNPISRSALLLKHARLPRL